MSVLNCLFGNNKKKEIKKEAIVNRQNLNRVPKYTSYNDDYERIKRKDNTSSIVEDVVIGSFLSNNDSSPNYSSYDSDNSNSGFSSGFGGGDYSGVGSSGD